MKKKEKNNPEEEAIDMTDLISQSQAAELRGVSRAAIADLVRRGRLRSFEIGGRALVYRSEVQNFKHERGWPKGKARKQ